MDHLRNRSTGPWLCSMAMIGIFMTEIPAYSSEGENEIRFSTGSYELPAAVTTEVKGYAESIKSDPGKKLRIQEQTKGLKPNSLSFILERTRALKIFQALVRDGVDASRVELEPVAPIPTKKDTVTLEMTEFSGEAIPKIVPTDSKEESGGEFILRFASGSAIPENFNPSEFQSFLATVGRPNRDAIAIEGYTDSVGNAKYNQALGNLRALAVFELLVRQGLPPYRVETNAISKSSSPGKGSDSADDRKVVIRWTQNAAIAKEAVQVEAAEAPPLPPAAEPVVPAPLGEPSVIAETPPDVAQAPHKPESSESSFDLVLFAGSLFPEGELKDHAKTGTTYGIGVGKALYSGPESELRATLYLSGKSRLEAKESTLSGPLDINSYSIRADYVYGASTVRPFIGVGLGLYDWSGSIIQNASQLRNVGSKNDLGGYITVGLDFALTSKLFLGPEASWHEVGGEFSESLLSGVLSLRWRL